MLERIQQAITNWFHGIGNPAMSLEDVEAPAHAPPAAHTHKLDFMSRQGHTTVTWNPDDAESVRKAREQFESLRASRHSLFNMDPILENGIFVERKGRPMTEFDPTVGRIMAVPHIVGG